MASSTVLAKPSHLDDTEIPWLGTDSQAVSQSMRRHLVYTLAELPTHIDTVWEPYVSLALSVRDRLLERWIATQDA